MIAPEMAKQILPSFCRRAQKRFREREKVRPLTTSTRICTHSAAFCISSASENWRVTDIGCCTLSQERQEQRQNAMATLEAELASLAKAKEALEERNAVLEKAVALRQGQACMAADPKAFDPQTYVEAKVDDSTALIVTVGKQSRQLTQREVSEMTRRDHLNLYQVPSSFGFLPPLVQQKERNAECTFGTQAYVDELRQLLAAADDQEREDRMVTLVRELCALNLAVALAKPKEFAEFQASRMDEEEPPSQPSPPPASVWKRCLASPSY